MLASYSNQDPRSDRTSQDPRFRAHRLRIEELLSDSDAAMDGYSRAAHRELYADNTRLRRQLQHLTRARACVELELTRVRAWLDYQHGLILTREREIWELQRIASFSSQTMNMAQHEIGQLQAQLYIQWSNGGTR
ncbi:hypothetical protein HMN09_00644400 [Mycena chlorophos]|uniref:Uncharacterized protein n=1 Tax=Mycena chlorophos TaxID=658473 RepID=A0A8H6T541_MYCCL|nr:hypothetical protein HMN09_00644400 [Mycena chlorophos]